MQIIHDQNSENITKIAAHLTKLSQKQVSLGVYGMSVISEEHNLARYGVNIVNMQWNIFKYVYVRIVFDKSVERMTKSAKYLTRL